MNTQEMVKHLEHAKRELLVTALKLESIYFDYSKPGREVVMYYDAINVMKIADKLADEASRIDAAIKEVLADASVVAVDGAG